MKITLEVPDTTVTGFVNLVFSTSTGLSLGTIAIDSEAIVARTVSYKNCSWGQEDNV